MPAPPLPARRLVSSALQIVAGALLLALCSVPALAHPHVFVEAREELVFDAAGRVTAVRHAWRFDDAFSAFATQGLDTNHDGVLSQAELAPLARVNMESLKQYGYFTFFYRGGERLPLAPPREYWLASEAGRLTLFFTVPLPSPLDPTERPVRLDVFDPEFYVSFTLVDDAPVALVAQAAKGGTVGGRVPSACRFTLKRPAELDAATAASLAAIPQDEHDLPPALRTVSRELANTIMVSCSPEAATTTAAGAPAGGPPVGASPFGVGLAEGGGTPTGLFALAASWQQVFYARLTGAVRSLHDDPIALLALVLVSLGYGVAHAVGPGHGKAVISAYLVSSRGTIRRAVLVAVLSSLLQAAVAVAVVTVTAVLLGWSSLGLTAAAEWVETISFAAVTLLGLSLVWRKIARPVLLSPAASRWTGRFAGLWTADRPLATGFASAAASRVSTFQADGGDAPAPARGFGSGGFGSGGIDTAARSRWHLHGPACGCAEAMLPDAADASSRSLLAVIVSAGLRPCTGALIVLVFALSQNLYWAGVASAFAMAAGTAVTVTAIAGLTLGARAAALKLASRDGRFGARLHAGLEAAGAVLVLAMGALLLSASLAGHLG